MTCAIICRYIMEGKASRKKRTLWVCGPTNKSVVVLARKVIQCVERDKSVNVVLVGDKTELLADDPELDDFFAHSYTANIRKSISRICGELESTGDLETFRAACHEILANMKRRLRLASQSNFEMVIENAVSAFERYSLDEMEHPNPDEFVRDASVQERDEALEEVLSEFKKLDHQKVVQVLLESSDVIFCTLSTAGSTPMKRMASVDDVIVDEASACTESEIMIPIEKKPNRLLLVGDPNQLPATVKSEDAKRFNFGRSLQERLMFHNNYEYTMLDTQYRMKPEISAWPLAQFYQSKIFDGDNVQQSSYSTDAILTLGGDPYSWIHVFGQEHKDNNGSTFNEREAEAVVSILLDLKSNNNISNKWFSNPERIRIITFYKAQEDYLRFKLKQYHIDALVSTVDAAQGCESDVVILSFVRGTTGHMGFIKDTRRLNVALTRARFQLVCVGNLDAMAELPEKGGNDEIREMAKDALERAVIFDEPPMLPPPPPLRPKTSKHGKKNINGSKKRGKPKSPKGTREDIEKLADQLFEF
jgi:AAA domain